MIKEGKIVKAIAGFFYVNSNDVIYECRGSGLLRKANTKPCVGDNVEIKVSDDDEKIATVVKVFKRNNFLIRPNVANVDKVIVVFAIENPKPNLALLDKFLIMLEKQNLEITICVNKIDIGDSDKTIKEVYEKAGYKVIYTSALDEIGIEPLLNELKDNVTVFSGPSGVGKSSLINKLQEDFALEIGEISKKLKRGKHTTRHVELFELKIGGYVLDTPGFSSLELDIIDESDLKHYYREFEAVNGSCKFNTCNHISEPGCQVKQMVEEDEISEKRYENYVNIYNEIKDKVRKW